MLTPFYQVEASKTSFTMELGQKPSKNPSDYLIGESWSVPLSIVDTSKVDTSQVGSYKIKIYHGLQSFDCTVHIEDTTPPEIKTDIHSLTVLIGETLSLEKLSIRAHDYSKVTAFEISHATASLLDLDYTLEESYNLQTLFASGVDVCSDSYMFPYGG
ncbi:MAG: hypothetical protein IKJ01_03505, partial [Lachnospiraceae bacterium]|nr:hypothetical protein [Lachnospiraceae bacterium]